MDIIFYVNLFQIILQSECEKMNTYQIYEMILERKKYIYIKQFLTLSKTRTNKLSNTLCLRN